MEKAITDESFVQGFLKKHENEIASSEPHYRLYEEAGFSEIPAYRKTDNFQHFGYRHANSYLKSNHKNSDPLVNWGRRSIGVENLLKKNMEAGETEKVIIAMIDSGMDLTRPELQGVIAINEKEQINGLDSDRNGFPDDYYGVNFVNEADGIKDYNGHGTHKVAVIVAQHDTGTVKGVAPGAVKILPLVVLDEDKSSPVKRVIRALRYASQRKVKIINASWGDPMACSSILKEEINYLAKKNILFVTPAGNDGLNLKENPMFPASFGLSNVIVVGASTPENKMAPFSNYGSSVDLVAPGTDIISTYPLKYDKDGQPDGLYSEDGTSSAVAFVSAAAALLWIKRPNAPYFEVKQALLEGVKPGPYPVNTGGHLYIPSALDALNL